MNVTNIAVGPHVTHYPVDSIEKCKGLDIVIKGEYDTKINEVLDNLENLEKVNGIVFKENGQTIDTGEIKYCEDLDSLPFPDRDTIPYQWYLEAWYSRKPFMNTMTSRGCPHLCGFCLWPHEMEGRKWRTRSIENVIEELKTLVNKYGVKEVNIDDSTFTIRKDRVIKFCRELRNNNLNLIWTCNGRVDNVDNEV